jgi:hypothetical protein
MRRLLIVVLALGVAMAVGASSALAQNPHFIKNATTVTRSDNSLTADFKLSGLGDEPFIDVVLSADAACINRGQNHPKAENKESFSEEGTFAVKNGSSEGSLTVTATFQPSCSPPMSVVFSNVMLTATEPDGTVITFRFSGTF